jgi:hypothetical protein
MNITIEGHAALAFAKLCHVAGLDKPGQWGNAYFRCPNCGEAWDCTGSEDWKEEFQLACECDFDLTIEDLRISEGWLEREFEAAVAKLAERIGGAGR